MSVTLFASTFVTVFLAELGDKTQLATFALATDAASPLAVFLGAALALTATSAIGVLAGAAVGQAIPAVWVRRAAGLLFVALGLFYLLRS
jgi:putative Ca2+/H+ antiporter (TMEM165/GDT1 family)